MSWVPLRFCRGAQPVAFQGHKPGASHARHSVREFGSSYCIRSCLSFVRSNQFESSVSHTERIHFAICSRGRRRFFPIPGTELTRNPTKAPRAGCEHCREGTMETKLVICCFANPKEYSV